ncbi:MAG: UbiA family prenyltransferase [Thermoplasmata archaeon]|nr:MAG: UbiA family prenyltransferase [Thermoplasmata archaeon]
MSHRIREKIDIYVQLIRPFTMIPPGVGVISGGLLALGFYGRLSINSPIQTWAEFNFIPLIIGAILYSIFNGASNAYNQVTDLEVDRINRPERPIPSGKLTIKEALRFAYIVYAIGLVVAFFISIPFFMVTVLCLMITTLYSTPPIQLKKRFLISNMTIAFCQSWLFVLAGWVVYSFSNPFEPTLWFIGMILFIFLVGACGTKDFTEVEGDKKYGMKTLPVLYGNEKAARITGPFFVLPFVLIPVGVLLGILPHTAIYLTIFVVYGIYLNINLKNLSKPRKKGENSPSWLHYYLMLMTLQLSFSSLYLIW